MPARFTELSGVLKLKLLVVIGFMALILYSLFSGLYFMMRDKGGSDRMVHALTWRIGLSVGLIVLVMIGIATGLIQPNGQGS